MSLDNGSKYGFSVFRFFDISICERQLRQAKKKGELESKAEAEAKKELQNPKQENRENRE